MKAKKTDEANIEKLRGSILGMSFLFVAGIVGVAFAFMQASDLGDNKKDDRQASAVNVIEETQEEAPEPEQPKPQEPEQIQATPPPTEELVEVEDTQTEPEVTVTVDVPEPEPEDEPEGEIVEEEIVEFPDVEASFPGGTAEMKKWIVDNMEYPETAMEMNEQGKVYLEFVVEKDGSISKIKVKRGVSDDIDREAKRVLRAMPKWKPGEANGKVVRTTCTIPINFVLN